MTSTNAADDPVLQSLTFSADTPTLTEQKWQQNKRYGLVAAGVQLLTPCAVYCELLTEVDCVPLPNSPAHFSGLCNVRGNLLPVYQLEPLLGLPVSASKFVLMMGTLPHAAGIVIAAKPKSLIDSTLEKVADPEALIAMPDWLRSTIVETFREGDKVWCSPDFEGLFRTLVSKTLAVS